jgi:ketosteroid isomerase-like protein
MNKKFIVVILSTYLSGCAVHAHVDIGNEEKDRAAIDALREQFLTAMIDGVPEDALAVFADDVVVMAPDQPAFEGIAAAGEWAEVALPQKHPKMTFETDELELSGDWAIERGTHWRGAGKRLWVYRRDKDGDWRIKYMMWSDNAQR